MRDAASQRSDLAGRSILVVEDDYMIATDLARGLQAKGAKVIGPVPSVEAALDLIRTAPTLDAALLDLNLQGEMSFPVADALLERGVPFAFTTGYCASAIPARYAGVSTLEKPVNLAKVAAALFC